MTRRFRAWLMAGVVTVSACGLDDGARVRNQDNVRESDSTASDEDAHVTASDEDAHVTASDEDAHVTASDEDVFRKATEFAGW
ncbi:MAG: hypothetical protein AAGC53_03455 [Actinomycetota bacterium]